MSEQRDITEEEVLQVIQGRDEETQKKLVCALVGHSKIQTTCFGYYYCSRCGDQVGDSLGSVYFNAPNVVIVGHDCDICRANYNKCDWKDKLLSPDPFKTRKMEACHGDD